MDAASSHRDAGAPRPQVAVLGQWQHVEFGEALNTLSQTADVQLVATRSSLPNHPPDCVLIAQSHPYGVSVDVVRAVREQFPQSPIVALLGSWCEGELRTGRPRPSVERVYWYHFPAWWRRFLDMKGSGIFSAYRAEPGKPLMAEKIPDPLEQAGTVLVDCRDRETFEALADSLSGGQCVAVWLQPGRPWPLVIGAFAGIWVGGQLTDMEVPLLTKFCDRFAGDSRRVVALLDFPRHDRVQRARELGATAVLARPWREEELCDALGFSLEPAGSTVAESAIRDAA